MSLKFIKSEDRCEETVEQIKCVSVFLECVKHKWNEWTREVHWDPNEGPWFRGTHNASFSLLPGIYRGNDNSGWDYNDENLGYAEDMKAEFARRALPFLKQYQHFREGEYLHLMQHYRYPTRLLDWTEGALIALYFAVRASQQQDKYKQIKKKKTKKVV